VGADGRPHRNPGRPADLRRERRRGAAAAAGWGRRLVREPFGVDEVRDSRQLRARHPPLGRNQWPLTPGLLRRGTRACDLRGTARAWPYVVAHQKLAGESPMRSFPRRSSSIPAYGWRSRGLRSAQPDGHRRHRPVIGHGRHRPRGCRRVPNRPPAGMRYEVPVRRSGAMADAVLGISTTRAARSARATNRWSLETVSLLSRGSGGERARPARRAGGRRGLRQLRGVARSSPSQVSDVGIAQLPPQGLRSRGKRIVDQPWRRCPPDGRDDRSH